MKRIPVPVLDVRQVRRCAAFVQAIAIANNAAVPSGHLNSRQRLVAHDGRWFIEQTD